MATKLKTFAGKRSAVRSIKSFILQHVTDINVNEENKTVNVMIDKKYSYNALCQTHLIEPFVEHLKKVYSEDYDIKFFIITARKGPNREMLIPHSIHFSNN